MLVHGFAAGEDAQIKLALDEVINTAPLRHMQTPGGFRMSVAMTNCGDYGWVSDRSGYRYDACDPLTGKAWPVMPQVLRELATSAAATAGFENFIPDVCLVNCYETGARLSLHQDKDEKDFSQPIVSISLGVPATFLFGGLKRKERPRRIPLYHGDVVVWGGPDRMRYHGVAPLRQARHMLFGDRRFNLTFRKAV